MKKTREFKLEDGTSINATFGMLDIGRCREKLKSITMSAIDVLTAMQEGGFLDENGNIKDAGGLPSEVKESLLDMEYEKVHARFLVASVGLGAANKEMKEEDIHDTLDENPSLITEIFDFYGERNAIYHQAHDYDPIEEDKETKKKKT